MRINVAADMQKREVEKGEVGRGVLELNLSSHGAAIYSNLFAWPWSLHSRVGMEWQRAEGLREWTQDWFEGHGVYNISDERWFVTLYLRDGTKYK